MYESFVVRFEYGVIFGISVASFPAHNWVRSFPLGYHVSYLLVKPAILERSLVFGIVAGHTTVVDSVHKVPRVVATYSYAFSGIFETFPDN